jgi:hypothetical protein
MEATWHAPGQQTTKDLYRKSPLLAAPPHHLAARGPSIIQSEAPSGLAVLPKETTPLDPSEV